MDCEFHSNLDFDAAILSAWNRGTEQKGVKVASRRHRKKHLIKIVGGIIRQVAALSEVSGNNQDCVDTHR